MKHMQACLSAKKDGESYFHYCGGLLQLAERNPGPRYKFPCTVCAKPVTSVQQGIECSKCGKWTHAKCCGVAPVEYQRIGENDSELWFCPDCLRRELPFIEASFNSSYNNGLDPDDRCASIGPDHTKLNAVVFCHLNARSLLQKMEEIRSFVQERSQQSWVIGIGETWLNNTVDDGEVGLEGYKIYRKDRRNQ